MKNGVAPASPVCALKVRSESPHADLEANGILPTPTFNLKG